MAAATQGDGMMATRPRASGEIVRLKVTLRGIRPPIWRRLLMPSSTRLPSLHAAIQRAMGWDGGHLYMFDIGGDSYGDPDMVDDLLDESRLTLGAVQRMGLKRFTYTYDFGDDWEHVIDIEGTEPAVPGKHYPTCVAGKRNAPPDDCGGIYGYAEALAILGDPSHPEHAEYTEQFGDDFDPEAFSLDAINAALAE
jgi:hypothetical protein